MQSISVVNEFAPLSRTPPPSALNATHELSLTVQSVSVVVPLVKRGQTAAAAGEAVFGAVAADRAVGQRDVAALVAQAGAVAAELAADPGGIAGDRAVGQGRRAPVDEHAAAAAASRAPRDGQAVKSAVTPPSTWNTRLAPPALIVTPACGPLIVSVPVMSDSSSWPPVRAIVCGVWNTVMSKTIV